MSVPYIFVNIYGRHNYETKRDKNRKNDKVAAYISFVIS